MHLIAPLAAGIRGAENGTVDLVLRGTSTPSTYYGDFEATQQFLGSGVVLDSFGRLIAYVSALVTVRVHDINGVFVCEFVAGDEDAAVEVISPSFTGVDYTTGASGTQKPTTLEKVLDGWITSAGTSDWKVMLNGAPINISAAFSAAFFSVRTYGALGNGISDDRAAIVAAQAAAVAAGGGVVFFPAGVYRITSDIPLSGGVTWLGCGGLSTKLAADGLVPAITLPNNGVGQASTVSGMWLGGINTAPSALVTASATSTGQFNFTDCVFGSDLLCKAPAYVASPGSAGLKTVFTRCYMRLNMPGGSELVISQGGARLIMRDCELTNTNTLGSVMVRCDDNGLFEGNRFDCSAATAGAVLYIACVPSSLGSVVIVGNQFAAVTAVLCVAIQNTMAAPFRDFVEYGNMFGNMLSSAPGCTPYAYTTDGYAPPVGFVPVGGRQTRYTRVEGYSTGAATQTVDPKAFGTTTIQRTAGAALTVNANKGSLCDRWTLQIINGTGVSLTVSPGTNMVFDPGVASGTLVIPSLGYSFLNLQWMPNASGTANWYMTGKAVTA